MRETWVVGAASNRYGKMSETAREAATRVALEAIRDAGLEPKQIGHTFVANCFGLAEHQAHVGPLINNGLGIPEVPSVTLESACSSSSAALHEAFVHVAGGFADAALVVGAERLSHLDTLAATSYFAIAADYAFETKNGATFPGSTPRWRAPTATSLQDHPRDVRVDRDQEPRERRAEPPRPFPEGDLHGDLPGRRR